MANKRVYTRNRENFATKIYNDRSEICRLKFAQAEKFKQYFSKYIIY
jgi:hypothetical protein